MRNLIREIKIITALSKMFTANMKFLLWLSGVLAVASTTEEFTGKLAKPGQFPFAVRLYSKTKSFAVTYCTATIVARGKLLTAGHCCRSKALRFVVSGDPDQTNFVLARDKHKYAVTYVKKIVVHPGFEQSEEKLVHDLCLLLLEKPLSAKDGHETIEISYEKMKGTRNCTALGWGSNAGRELQHKLYYKRGVGYRCNLRFGNSSKYWFVCLEPHSVCPGDSGGPLVCDGKLFGIASFFIGDGDETYPRCEEGVVDYYSELSSEREFVEAVVSEGPRTSSGCTWMLPLVVVVVVVVEAFARIT